MSKPSGFERVQERPGHAFFNADNYSASQNNRKATSVTDAVSGETVSYTYLALNRLTQALSNSSSAPWGQSFTYDIFGNLTDNNVVSGSAPTWHRSAYSTQQIEVGPTHSLYAPIQMPADLTSSRSGWRTLSGLALFATLHESGASISPQWSTCRYCQRPMALHWEGGRRTPVDALAEKLDARLREWKPGTAAEARERITEVTRRPRRP